MTPRCVARADDEFPELLHDCDETVEQLWVLGDRLDHCQPAVAIVGSRGPTSYGLEIAHTLASDLAEFGITIVSGMARGIDAAAHEGALSVGGRTVAVLGTGVDVVYPVVNKPLYKRIAECGALVSEFPLGAAPRKEHFPARNRIIAGLSLATLLVQARSEKSGALVTVNWALQFGRDVFAVPGDVRSELSSGPHQALRDGATICTSAADVIFELGKHVGNAVRLLSQEEAALIAALEYERPARVDALAARTDLPPHLVLRTISKLEMAGVAVRTPTGEYKLPRNP